MPDQKISELSAITTIDNSADVLPIVDTSATTTKKVTPTQLKTSLALNNVDNTSDANKPISSATQTALDAKQDTLVSGTNIKTVNSTSLLGSGDVAVQATLVSGTNIKTINSTSLLGSGDITISASPSGVSGAIQFSNGSAFASDAANLFWDDTNNYLGIGTNTPSVALEVQNNARIRGGLNLNGSLSNSSTGIVDINGLTYVNAINGFVGVGVSTPSARLHARGSGSTSATTSLLVQNSAGTESMRVRDDLQVVIGGGITSTSSASWIVNGTFYNTNTDRNHFGGAVSTSTFLRVGANGNPVSSAQLQVDSTTRGFLPPVMTTTQKNAIASPAAGLVVYDNTTNKLCCYNGSTWNDLF